MLNMELVLQHQKLNKMETYKVFIDYVEGPGEVEWNCPHIPLPRHVVEYQDVFYMIDGTLFKMDDNGFVKVTIVAHSIGKKDESIDD